MWHDILRKFNYLFTNVYHYFNLKKNLNKYPTFFLKNQSLYYINLSLALVDLGLDEPIVA
jgi:hypothetical protein